MQKEGTQGGEAKQDCGKVGEVVMSEIEGTQLGTACNGGGKGREVVVGEIKGAKVGEMGNRREGLEGGVGQREGGEVCEGDRRHGEPLGVGR